VGHKSDDPGRTGLAPPGAEPTETSESGSLGHFRGVHPDLSHRSIRGIIMRRAALLVVTACSADRLARPARRLVSAAARPCAKAPPCVGKTANSAVKAIKKTWSVLLNGTGPATLDQKAAVIQGTNDPAFRQVFDGIAAANPPCSRPPPCAWMR